MASGDVVGHITAVIPPGASAATIDTRAGGSTPAEAIRVWDFDASSSEYMDFMGYLEGYDAGGLTVTLYYSMSSATSDQVRWEVAFRSIEDDAEDIDSSHSYAFNGVSDTVPSAAGEISMPTITFTDGADMDNVDDGDWFIFRIYRDHDHADDDATGDAELWGFKILET